MRKPLFVRFMKKILLIIFILGFIGCSKTEQESGGNATDSFAPERPVETGYEFASAYRELDSDSLLLGKGDIVEFSRFYTNGIKIREQEYGGGDCDGKFMLQVLGADTLTIEKYDCGDYGFGNTLFITNADSLMYVREFSVEWSPDDDGNVFHVNENIFEFSTTGLVKRTRTKPN